MGTIETVIQQISQFTIALNAVSNDIHAFKHQDIRRFLEQTDKIQEELNWQGRSLFALTAISAALGVAGVCMPHPPAAGTPIPFNPMWTTAKETCSTASQFFHGASAPAQSWSQARSTKLQSEKDLTERINIQFEQGAQSAIAQQVQTVETLASQLIQSRARAG